MLLNKSKSNNKNWDEKRRFNYRKKLDNLVFRLAELQKMEDPPKKSGIKSTQLK